MAKKSDGGAALADFGKSLPRDRESLRDLEQEELNQMVEAQQRHLDDFMARWQRVQMIRARLSVLDAVTA